MARSLKKGPFVEPKLLRRIEGMNRTGEKRVVRTWSRASTVFPQMVGHTIPGLVLRLCSRRWWGTRLRCTMAGGTCRSTSPRTW
jgi:hypothetical protein